MQKRKILVVEDEAIVAKDIALTLENLGYHVVATAASGEEAIKKAEQEQPDLVLMDIKLKGKMDGFDAAKKITAKTDAAIVFLTAYSDDQMLERAQETKAFGYIVKPVEEKNLKSTVKMALGKKQEMEKTLGTKTEQGSVLDLYDRKILSELDSDARASASEIGRRIRLPKGTVNYRIKKLVENGFVRKFFPAINATLLGYQYFLIALALHGVAPETEKKMLERLRAQPCCVKTYSTENGLYLLTLHKNASDVPEFLENILHDAGQHVSKKEVFLVTRQHYMQQTTSNETQNPTRLEIDSRKSALVDLDATDKELLRLLENDARMELISLADKTKKDWKVVKYRLKKMQEKKVILAFRAEVDLHKMGKQTALASMNLAHPSLTQKVTEFFCSNNACVEAFETLGSREFFLELQVKDETSLKELTHRFKQAFAKQCSNLEISRIDDEQIVNTVPPL